MPHLHMINSRREQPHVLVLASVKSYARKATAYSPWCCWFAVGHFSSSQLPNMGVEQLKPMFFKANAFHRPLRREREYIIFVGILISLVDYPENAGGSRWRFAPKKVYKRFSIESQDVTRVGS
ncbi:hypothetical protein M514_07332 [Trichuris suis]|uniref:Uncharacterized protein n=1 Tax=Trichuris suis TaxID=68888 RepID=A0A085M3K9_9BILA|nr:hypothetical protein M513_07332 [Trichuris suis]KFD68348.1 hypothetical protein M514_07332 [Trichuris suis]